MTEAVRAHQPTDLFTAWTNYLVCKQIYVLEAMSVGTICTHRLEHVFSMSQKYIVSPQRGAYLTNYKRHLHCFSFEVLDTSEIVSLLSEFLSCWCNKEREITCTASIVLRERQISDLVRRKKGQKQQEWYWC